MDWLDILLWFREHTTPWLDTLMGVITNMGSEYFYLSALCLLYWCVDVAATLRLFVLFLASVYLNDAIKWIAAARRPFDLAGLAPASSLYARTRELAEQIPQAIKDTAPGYSFPSAHAQDAVVFWGYLAIVVRRRWMYILAPLVALLVAFSRIYLGVHWPQDVIAGMVIGLIILGYGYMLLRLLAGMPVRARFPATLLFCLVPILLFVLFPSHAGGQTMGTLFGALLGYLLERRYLRFAVRRPLWQQMLKVVIGLSGALLLMIGLSTFLKPLDVASSVRAAGEPAALPGGFLYTWGREIPTWIRYALVGLWCTLGAPALFRLLFGGEVHSAPAP